MDKILEFLNKRIEDLRNINSEEPDILDGEGIYNVGYTDGRFAELFFIQAEIKKVINGE